jgi:hypothetical protein
MEETRLLLADTGTTAKTFFSYAVSSIQRRNFRDPELLGDALCDIMPHLRSQYIKIANWNIHYALGFMFTMLYAKALQEVKIDPNTRNGIVLGALTGCAGIVAWRIAKNISSKPLWRNPLHLLSHLSTAHLIFGVVSAVAYKVLDREAYKARNNQRVLNQYKHAI